MNKKENIPLNPSSQKVEKMNKPPLFKLFMNNSNRKLHLINNNTSNSKDSAKSNFKSDNNNQNRKIEKIMPLNLQLFSYKILEAKHNSTPELYFKKKLNILIKKKKSHLLADFNERALNDCQFREYLKRYYTYQETEERIPKYVGYYKNYLAFFCRPFFTGYFINKKMVKHMEKVAQIFYNENYADEKEEEEDENPKKKEKNIVIFSKKILKEIDDVDVNTVVTSEAAMKQIQKMNSLVNKNNQKNSRNNNELKIFDSNTVKIQNNNINQIKIEELSIYDNSYKLTPIKSSKLQMENINKSKNTREYANKLDGKIEINTKDIISGLKNQDLIPSTTNSINLLIEEMESKDKENNSKRTEEEKEKNEINNIPKNCIVIQGGKTTNHINININHLTIGQKILPQKEDQSNKNDKQYDGLVVIKNNNSKNKAIKKFRNINPDLEPKFSSEIKNEVNLEKEKDKEKQAKKNCVLTLPPPTHNLLSRTNSMINKKLNQIFPSTINNNNNLKLNKNMKNQNFFKSGYNSGTVTNLNKYISLDKKKGNKSQQQLNKHTLYINYYNGLSNIFKNINYMTSKASKNIIINTKTPGILSGQRTRNTNSMKNKSKRVIYSSLHFNCSSLQLLNLKNNIGTTKNSEKRFLSHGREFIEYKMANNNDKIPLIKSRENKNKPAKIGLKIKAKHLNFQKLLNPISKNLPRGRSTDK